MIKDHTTWIDRELRSSRAKRVIKAKALMDLKGEVDYKILGQLYRPKEAIPEASARRFLKQTKVKAMIDQELEKMLLGNNITYDTLIKERKAILTDVKEDNEIKPKDKYEIRLKVIEGFEDMKSMRTPKKETNTITHQLDYKQIMELGDKKQTNTLKATQTKEIEPEQISNNNTSESSENE